MYIRAALVLCTMTTPEMAAAIIRSFRKKCGRTCVWAMLLPAQCQIGETNSWRGGRPSTTSYLGRAARTGSIPFERRATLNRVNRTRGPTRLTSWKLGYQPKGWQVPLPIAMAASAPPPSTMTYSASLPSGHPEQTEEPDAGGDDNAASRSLGEEYWCGE